MTNDEFLASNPSFLVFRPSSSFHQTNISTNASTRVRSGPS
jgi:hypothetical protein